MVAFGVMDQFIMIRLGDLLDNSLGVTLGLATLTAAAVGQLCSDTAGVLFGNAVESLAQKFLRLSPPPLSSEQRLMPACSRARTSGAAFGVALGCLIGMGQLLFLDLDRAERVRHQQQLDGIFESVILEGPRLFNCERGILYLYDPSRKEIWTKAICGDIHHALRMQRHHGAHDYCPSSSSLSCKEEGEEVKKKKRKNGREGEEEVEKRWGLHRMRGGDEGDGEKKKREESLDVRDDLWRRKDKEDSYEGEEMKKMKKETDRNDSSEKRARSMVLWVLENKRILNLRHPHEDPRFNPYFDERHGCGTYSVLAAPILRHSKRDRRKRRRRQQHGSSSSSWSEGLLHSSCREETEEDPLRLSSSSSQKEGDSSPNSEKKDQEEKNKGGIRSSIPGEEERGATDRLYHDEKKESKVINKEKGNESQKDEKEEDEDDEVLGVIVFLNKQKDPYVHKKRSAMRDIEKGGEKKTKVDEEEDLDHEDKRGQKKEQMRKGEKREEEKDHDGSNRTYFTEADERMLEMMAQHIQIFMEKFDYGAADDRHILSIHLPSSSCSSSSSSSPSSCSSCSSCSSASSSSVSFAGEMPKERSKISSFLSALKSRVLGSGEDGEERTRRGEEEERRVTEEKREEGAHGDLRKEERKRKDGLWLSFGSVKTDEEEDEKEDKKRGKEDRGSTSNKEFIKSLQVYLLPAWLHRREDSPSMQNEAEEEEEKDQLKKVALEGKLEKDEEESLDSSGTTPSELSPSSLSPEEPHPMSMVFCRFDLPVVSNYDGDEGGGDEAKEDKEAKQVDERREERTSQEREEASTPTPPAGTIPSPSPHDLHPQPIEEKEESQFSSSSFSFSPLLSEGHEDSKKTFSEVPEKEEEKERGFLEKFPHDKSSPGRERRESREEEEGEGVSGKEMKQSCPSSPSKTGDEKKSFLSPPAPLIVLSSLHDRSPPRILASSKSSSVYTPSHSTPSTIRTGGAAVGGARGSESSSLLSSSSSNEVSNAHLTVSMKAPSSSPFSPSSSSFSPSSSSFSPSSSSFSPSSSSFSPASSSLFPHPRVWPDSKLSSSSSALSSSSSSSSPSREESV